MLEPAPREIALTRDSVCLSDDVDAPHAARHVVPASLGLRDALQAIAPHYLAHVVGASVAWRAEADGRTLGWILAVAAADGTLHTQVRGVAPDAPLAVTAIHFAYVAANEMATRGPLPGLR